MYPIDRLCSGHNIYGFEILGILTNKVLNTSYYLRDLASCKMSEYLLFFQSNLYS
jgi:hypothetical protein